jgi:hypothetical protein
MTRAEYCDSLSPQDLRGELSRHADALTNVTRERDELRNRLRAAVRLLTDDARAALIEVTP